jgi:hypothetical protein
MITWGELLEPISAPAWTIAAGLVVAYFTGMVIGVISRLTLSKRK